MTHDYKSTINLPQTDFPMRGDLPKREPGWLAEWERIDRYAQIQGDDDQRHAGDHRARTPPSGL